MSTITPTLLLEYTDTTDQCGQTYWWKRNPTDPNNWKLIVWFCNRHGCRQCAARKTKRNGMAVLEYVGRRACHHLTLTVARTNTPLQRLLRHLRNSFRTLNRRPMWKRSIIGGIWFHDCTYDEYHERWGPHLHLVIEAADLQIEWIASAWLEITGDSWQVEATAIDQSCESRAGAVFYASKVAYQQFAHNAAAMREYLQAVKGLRKAQPFGAWYGRLKLNSPRTISESCS